MSTLSLVKQHCRIDADFSGEDELITLYLGAACRHVENLTNRTLYKDPATPGYLSDEEGLLLNDDVKAAILLLVGHWYANREAVTTLNALLLPFGVEDLLRPYRLLEV